ncbi:MAG: AAA family ATPase [Myxococcota bacterium]
MGQKSTGPQSGEFQVKKGPVFTNVLLADEINRAPAKVQSALLEAMQERQVTIGETTHALPDPFLVLATRKTPSNKRAPTPYLKPKSIDLCSSSESPIQTAAKKRKSCAA